MAILPIRIVGDPVLHKATEPVTQSPAEIAELIADMYETMDAANGVGLAANQVGVSLRVFVYDCPGDDRSSERRRGVVVNPVLETSEIPQTMPDPEEDFEGCLSVPGEQFPTGRADWAKVTGTDADGNPINIAAIVVWQVADTARAVFAVEAYEEFIKAQAESALRHVATTHPYDEPGPGETSLRGGTDLVSGELAAEVATRVALAGLEIVEVRISSLAYAPEIAQAMLQRQQAGAVIAAREQIVEGAVTMVDQALRRLENDDIVDMDDERRAQMVSNLLVVLCSDQRTQPVVNTGSLYA